VIVVTGCSRGDKNQAQTPSPSTGLPQEQTGTPAPAQPTDTNETLCPLTGLPITPEELSLRPIAVMIDNFATARPQSGLMNAEIVYEMPAEGGITRYMAIFHHLDTEKIGPVRSARPYFIDKAMEYNAVYIHAGGSNQALEDIQTLKVDALNDLKGDGNFWRSKDRKMPHNLYTNTKLTREVMSVRKLDNKKWSSPVNVSSQFVDLDGKLTNSFSIDYKQGYKVGYQYDQDKKVFFRTINGTRLKDKETGTEISTVNMIVERVSSQVIDKAGRLELSDIGKGDGYFLTAGKLIQIKWSKDSRQAKTIYTDLKGNPIKLNKGNTWIQVVPDYATIEIKE
jgi:hypothetical protein